MAGILAFKSEESMAQPGWEAAGRDGVERISLISEDSGNSWEIPVFR